MTRSSPLRKLHRQAEASLTTWAPQDPRLEGEIEPIEIVRDFGDPLGEHDALRAGAALLDRPDRGAIAVEGEDRIDLLNRMLTQELADLAPWFARRSFWLTRKGRIDADLRVIHTPQRTIFDLDAPTAARTIAGLDAFVFAEDVAFTDMTETHHHLSLHGPAALELVRGLASEVEGAPLEDFTPGSACEATIAGYRALIDRQDSTGEIGLELLVPAEGAVDVHNQITEAGMARNGGSGRTFRAAGAEAWNIARLENGWPLYYVDFGPDSLPHETGALRDRVSFTKGCYLGQEVVARMESLGKPKQILVSLALEGEGPAPNAGDPLRLENQPDSDPVGAVTSAAALPALDGGVGCFAKVRYKHAATGARLLIEAQDGSGRAGGIRDRLSFLQGM